jgi:hypothetical protein
MADQVKTSAFASTSLWVLVASNVLTIILALWQGWNLGLLMFVYWCQSIIIGIFCFVRMLTLKEFSAENVRINNVPVTPGKATQLYMSFFFAVHYSFFHFGYLLFMFLGFEVSIFNQDALTLVSLSLTVIVFFCSHLFTYFSNRERDLLKKQNIGTLMFTPYLRIIPMHLTILFGALAGGAIPLLIFLVLKTIADAGMHIIEHRA